MRLWRVGGVLTMAILWSGVVLASAGAGITYHGRLLKSDGTPVTSSSVQFQIQIRTPGSENCLMYQETQTKDLSSTSGVFSITINDGTATTPNTEPFTLSELFKNSGTFSFGTGKCSGASTYSPNITDGRKLAVSFNDGSGWETLPAQEINFVPMALESESVGGKTPSSFLRVDSSSESSNTTELTSANLTEFWKLINGTSSQYLKTSTGGAALPSFSSNPSSPSTGSIWYDSTDNKVKFYDGSGVQTVGTSGGSVTGITVGTGLVDGSGNTGTTITTSGTIKLPSVGTADTYYKVTTDAEGRVTSGSTSLGESDLPTITTAGKVSGSAITSGTIGGSTAIASSGDITTSGDLSVHSITSSGNVSLTAAGGSVSASYIKGHDIQIYDSVAAPNTHMATIEVPASLSDNYTLILPPDDGDSGQVLSTDGAGELSWISPATGSVTSVTASAPLNVDATTASAPALSISKADASTDGYLSSTDWTTFNNKLSAIGNTAVLSDGKIWIGDSGGKAQEKSLSGDIGLTDAGVTSVNKIKGYGVDFSTAPTSGNFLKYNGSNWTAASITESDVSGLTTDLSDKISSSQMPANCTSGQTLTFSSPTGTWACSDITVSGSNFASQTANTILAAPTSANGTPTFRALTTDDLPSGVATQWSSGTGGAIYYNGGNVGIGTTSPTTKLTIRANANGTNATFNGGVPLLRIEGSGTWSEPSIEFAEQSLAPIASIAAKNTTGGAGDLIFLTRTNGDATAVEKVRIKNNGNVGIGTTSPSDPLHIYSTSTLGNVGSFTLSNAIFRVQEGATGSLYMDGNTLVSDVAGGLMFGSDGSTSPLIFISGGTEKMRIAAGGNVGIGTTSPSYKLDVNGDVNITGSFRVNGTTIGSSGISANQYKSATCSFNGGSPCSVTTAACDAGYFRTGCSAYETGGGTYSSRAICQSKPSSTAACTCQFDSLIQAGTSSTGTCYTYCAK